MAYRVEAVANLERWLNARGIVAHEHGSVSPTDVDNYTYRYRSAIVKRILSGLTTLAGCTIQSNPPGYLLLSPDSGKDSGTGYSLSSVKDQDGRSGTMAYGHQWIISYGNNRYTLRLFAIASAHARFDGVEVQGGLGDGNSQPELIVQMRSSDETQNAIAEIQFALQWWVSRIQQETPNDTEHSGGPFFNEALTH